jgi:hypothetical protein
MASFVCGSSAAQTATSTPKKRTASVEESTGSLMNSVLSEGIQEIVEILNACPAKILPTLKIVKANSIIASAEIKLVEARGLPFNSSYSKLWRTPKEFACALMTEEANSLVVTEALFERLERATEGTTRRVFSSRTVCCHRRSGRDSP